MAIAFTQGASGDGVTSLAYAVNVAALAFLWAWIRRGGTGSQPTALSGGGTWSKHDEVTVGADHVLGLWICPNASAGATTVAQTGGSGSSRMVIGEASGIATASPSDVSPAHTTGTSSTPTGPSITPVTADTLILGGFSTINDELVGYTPGAGYAEVGADITKLNGVYKIISSASAQTPNTTLSSGSNDWGAISAAFKIAGGGGGGGSFRNFYGSKFYGAQYAPTAPIERNLAVARYQRDRAAAMRRFMATIERRAA